MLLLPLLWLVRSLLLMMMLVIVGRWKFAKNTKNLEFVFRVCLFSHNPNRSAFMKQCYKFCACLRHCILRVVRTWSNFFTFTCQRHTHTHVITN